MDTSSFETFFDQLWAALWFPTAWHLAALDWVKMEKEFFSEGLIRFSSKKCKLVIDQKWLL